MTLDELDDVNLSHDTKPSFGKVLLLNKSEEILRVVRWQTGVRLLCSGRADQPWGHDDFYHIPTSRGTLFPLPTALVLTRYVRVPYRQASCTRENILKRDRYHCQFCGCELNANTYSIDHIIPESKGGGWSWKNLVAACKRCNNRKGDRTPAQAEMPLLREPFVPSRDLLIVNQIDAETGKRWRRWMPIEWFEDLENGD